MPSARPDAASAPPTRTKWRGARCGSPTCSIASASPPSSARSSTITTSFCSAISSCRAIEFQPVLESNLELGERLKPLVADVTGILDRLSVDGHERAVRGRARRDARRRSRHLPLRDFLDHHRGRRRARHGLGPRAVRRRARHRQGLRHPGRRRSISDGAVRRVRRALRAVWVTSSGRSPGGSGVAAGSTRWPCAAPSCTRAAHRSASPSSTCSTGWTPSACAWATGSTARSSTPRRLLSRTIRRLRGRVRGAARAGKRASVGTTRYEELPENARRYLERLQELLGVPIDLISTGPDRRQTIVRRHPFA